MPNEGQTWARWEAIGSLVFNASNIWYFVKLTFILRLILGFNSRWVHITVISLPLP
jgi:hypothetical protein